MKPYKYRSKILKGQEGLTLIMGNPDRDEMLTYSDSKGNIVTKPNVKAGFVSGTDPVGETYVSGIAMNPIFKAVGNSILYSLGKLGNTWARAKIVSKNLLNGKYNNIESSFAMEDSLFDEECAKRVKSVLNGELSVQDAIAELDEKYKKNCK